MHCPKVHIRVMRRAILLANLISREPIELVVFERLYDHTFDKRNKCKIKLGIPALSMRPCGTLIYARSAEAMNQLKYI